MVAESRGRDEPAGLAEIANRLGRTVYGVPGPITSGGSRGVHELVRTGRAVLVTDIGHIEVARPDPPADRG